MGSTVPPLRGRSGKTIEGTVARDGIFPPDRGIRLVAAINRARDKIHVRDRSSLESRRSCAAPGSSVDEASRPGLFRRMDLVKWPMLVGQYAAGHYRSFPDRRAT